MRSSRIVLLGAGGFIGRAITEKSDQIRGVSTGEIDLTGSDAGEKLSSVLRPEDVVIFASVITPDKGKDAASFLKNCEMARQVAEAVVKSPVARLVYISSDAVFAEDLPEITEETLPCPNSLYGTMHLAREQILREICAANGIPLLIIRLCAVYGPGDTHNSYGPNRFFQTAHEARSIRLFGEGEERRPHAHVEDVAQIILELISRAATGVVHAIPSPSMSFRQVAETVAQAFEVTSIEFVRRDGSPTHKDFRSTRLETLLPEFRFRDFPEAISTQAEAFR